MLFWLRWQVVREPMLLAEAQGEVGVREYAAALFPGLLTSFPSRTTSMPFGTTGPGL